MYLKQCQISEMSEFGFDAACTHNLIYLKDTWTMDAWNRHIIAGIPAVVLGKHWPESHFLSCQVNIPTGSLYD